MKEPLALPRGSVRALLALILVAAAVAMVFVPVEDKDFGTGLFALAGFAIRDYFATRTEQNQADGPSLHDPVVND
jgi:hypothetical protein